ncbi:ADP-ribosylglycohydrolase family protein [Synechococcus elongatus]|uniref:ADP-ribosylglycohydrolase family protein n=1 Tax=Synechococcus elongatus TaxID=32046 RepID=UPI001EE0DDDF|nr:ADP-ribosylglycohydrolase family protein [Synechococcus elongatus]
MPKPVSLSLAIGDALGAPVEFKKPGSFEPITGYRDGGPFNLKAGQWTDDSSMALCLAESLLACGKLDLKDNLDRYCRWWQHGENSVIGDCFDIGNGTHSALSHYLRTGEVEAGGLNALGNGALMRMAPIPIWSNQDIADAIDLAQQSSVTTHRHPQAIALSGYFAELLVRALQGESKADLLSGHWYQHPDAEIVEVVRGSWQTSTNIRAQGHALYALEAALWAFGTTTSFADCLLAAVNLGEDSDTVGAIAGQIAGAHYGLEAIPDDWIAGLQDSDRFQTLVEKLFNRSI